MCGALRGRRWAGGLLAAEVGRGGTPPLARDARNLPDLCFNHVLLSKYFFVFDYFVGSLFSDAVKTKVITLLPCNMNGCYMQKC